MNIAEKLLHKESNQSNDASRFGEGKHNQTFADVARDVWSGGINQINEAEQAIGDQFNFWGTALSNEASGLLPKLDLTGFGHNDDLFRNNGDQTVITGINDQPTQRAEEQQLQDNQSLWHTFARTFGTDLSTHNYAQDSQGGFNRSYITPATGSNEPF